MSTPQLEDGYVRIANALMEAVLAGGFAQRELLVLLTIMRKTYGFQKTEDDMSASQIGAMCKLARPHVTAVLNQLAQRNVITKRPGRFGSIVGIQKDHRKWMSLDQIAPASTDSVRGSTDSVHVPIQYAGSTDSVQVDSTDSVHTKDNLPKDNQQKTKSCAPQAKRDSDDGAPAQKKSRSIAGLTGDLLARFERFYAAYPRKRSAGAAAKVFAKLDPDDSTVDLMLATITRLQQSGEWRTQQYVPHPATWLNGAGWLDQVKTEYAVDEVEVIEAFNAALGDQLGIVALAPYLADRADAIRDFRTFSTKPRFVERFFPWLVENATFPPNVGFDWVISRHGYSNLTSGQHGRKTP